MIFEDWGLVSYKEALDKQLDYVNQLDLAIADNLNHPGFLIFCTHPPVVTTGRQTQHDDVFSWPGEIIEISRGGRATYHGPSQIVVYPIINLKDARHNRGPQEIRGYIRAFENAIVDTLSHFNIQATGKTIQKLPGQLKESDETGVWVGQKKIASLGIAVKKWITYHGAAINFYDDPNAFLGINPCGFSSSTMLNVEKIFNDRNEKIDINFEIQFKETLKYNLMKQL